MIYFHGVSKKFGSHTVLDHLDLHIEKGKITYILGKSGEGKSVTIKHIMGLLKPDKGQVVVDGTDLGQLTKKQLRLFRRKFGMLFQHAALFDSMSVLDNILFPLREHTKMAAGEMLAQANKVLTRIELVHLKHQFPNQLSTGEKKRVGLARALVAQPQILLYDEPTTGMDPLVSEMIDQLIVDINQSEKEMTSVVISHDIKAALASSHRIIMLYQGKVALAGSPDDFKNSNDPIVRQFFSGKVEGPMEFF